ncbi:hypothetical protein HK100_000507 [Physocladia obscura]|uniref:Mitochondrial 2-oxoglutarate/malate carrier protein n=1 Tax=Physocladia obscura TaxID=109957 RepID=A0AAD5XF64_9FUNG|nr:hypothetical protein HK100_000507 [Physocladia obscura]
MAAKQQQQSIMVATAATAPPATPTTSSTTNTSTSSASSLSLWAVVQPFVFGGLSGMTATTVIQPVDMVSGVWVGGEPIDQLPKLAWPIKVRIQLQGEGVKGKAVSPLSVASALLRTHGLGAFYTGLSAGLLRQATYTTARMGLFNTFMRALETTQGKPGIAERALAGLAAGGLGAVAGNPCDLALIRMQADGLAPPTLRKNYSSVFDAIIRISRQEGVLALWKGCGPTVVRAMALNLGMLSTYSEAKARFEPHLGANSTSTALASSAVAGFFASFFSLPFDFLKTRMQKQVPDAKTGQMLYKGTVDCAIKVFNKEGALAFYRGFGTYYIRIAPQ